MRKRNPTRAEIKRAKVEKRLRAEWGEDYERNVKLARQALLAVGTPEYFEWLDATGKGNDLQMIRYWLRVGERLRGSFCLQELSLATGAK
jgi:hypothetical protein